MDVDNVEILPEGVYITPPENDGENTDCDSGDEEDTDPNHLSSRQLRAEEELMYSRENKRILLNMEDDIEEGSEENLLEILNENERSSNNSQPGSESMQPLKKS